MNRSEEEFQEKIEKGHPVDDSLDARAYQTVFEALKKEPYELPSNFADLVVRRAESRNSLLRDYFWFGLGVLSFVIATIYAIIKIGLKPDMSVLRFISGYQGLFVFAAVIITMIQYLDKKLVKNKMSL